MISEKNKVSLNYIVNIREIIHTIYHYKTYLVYFKLLLDNLLRQPVSDINNTQALVFNMTCQDISHGMSFVILEIYDAIYPCV